MAAIHIIYKLAKSPQFVAEVVQQRLIRGILEALSLNSCDGTEEQLLVVVFVLCRANVEIMAQLVEEQHYMTLLMLLSHSNKNVQHRAAHVLKLIALNPTLAVSLPLDKVPAECADVSLPTQDELNWSLGIN